MTQEGFKRKLTAILSADAVGYSRLMRKDESATVRDITEHRALISEIIQQHHGRAVDSPDDNILYGGHSRIVKTAITYMNYCESLDMARSPITIMIT